MELQGTVVDVGETSPFEQIICVDLGTGELGFDLTIPKRLGITDVKVGDIISILSGPAGSISGTAAKNAVKSKGGLQHA